VEIDSKEKIAKKVLTKKEKPKLTFVEYYFFMANLLAIEMLEKRGKLEKNS
jgi:hypothetical protein